MITLIRKIKSLLLFFYCLCFASLSHANHPIFDIQLTPGSPDIPSQIGRYDPPTEHAFTITNQSDISFSDIQYFLPSFLIQNTAESTCSNTLNKQSSCQLVLILRPNQLGNFEGKLKACGGNGLWCSQFPGVLNTSVIENQIISTDCAQIQSRPFSNLTCHASEAFSHNFEHFLKQLLHQVPIHRTFRYFQHQPNANETVTPCLEARQPHSPLNPNIQGGGEALCHLMGYAIGNARPGKAFPSYLTRLLGTSYPITPHTQPLDQLDDLRLAFDTSLMDESVQSVGYTGHINFLTDYYQQQLSKNYRQCGITEQCPSIFYLPYLLTDHKADLEKWPPRNHDYWGITGGGGSGAGYQIQAFKSGSTTHYTLFSGGGGGGAGNTTPEGTEIISLLNTGSGGGGGNQFSDCYINQNGENLNGLGLGAGTGSGISAKELTHISFQRAPAVEYSYYKPTAYPSWNNPTTLNQYLINMDYLFNNLLPNLYNQGYTITVTGGGGGGTGLEFLNAAGEEFTPHPVSIGYGFNFCYAFNKLGTYTANDCISAPTGINQKQTLDQIIYQNLGHLFKQGMEDAILPQNCNGYTDYVCTCTFQHTYVVTELENLLVLNGFSRNDLPSWLMTPHCSQSETLRTASNMGHQYKKILQNLEQANSENTCRPPWLDNP